jgi:hypothetical protein
MSTQTGKQTLWQRLTAKKPQVPQEPQRYNPLNVKIASTVTINLADYQSKYYKVSGIREITRNVNGRKHKYVDYTLQYNDEHLRLRTIPNEDKYHLILLRLYDEILYDEEFLKICRDHQEFHVTDNDNNGEESIYYRVGDLKNPWKCNGEFTEGGVWNNYKMEYWDYSRITKDEADQDITQYLYIEMDKDSGRFQLWLGDQLEPSRVTVF